MYDRASMKQEVKQIISGVRPRPMWVALLYSVITSVGASLIQSVIGTVGGTNALSGNLTSLLMSGYELEEALSELLLMYSSQIVSFVGTLVAASLVSSILVVLWQGLMGVGFTGYCLSMVKGEKPTPGYIFCGFPMFGKVVLTALLVWVFTALWTLLYGVCLAVVIVIGALLMKAVPAVGVILMVLGYIGFLILVIRLSLRYSMAYYFLLDEGKSGLEAITASKQMMKGKKGKLFGLYLSFIGWYLLIYVVLVVGISIIAAIVTVVGAAGSAVGGASIGAIGGMVGGVLFVGLLTTAVTWLLSIWLQPYVSGTVAKFYLTFKPQAPAQQENWPVLEDTTSGGTVDYE